MSTSFDPNDPAANRSNTTSTSTYGEDRWQGPSFAASWISPPGPHRGYDDPMQPTREDDHA